MKYVLVVYPKKYINMPFNSLRKFLTGETLMAYDVMTPNKIRIWTDEYPVQITFISDPEYARGSNYDLIYDLQGTLTPWGTVTQGLDNFNILGTTIIANKGKMKVFHV